MSHCPGALSGNWPGKEVKPEERTCALCGIKLPEFNKDGKHNFVPHVINGEVKNLCMKCKMLFVPNSKAWIPRLVR